MVNKNIRVNQGGKGIYATTQYTCVVHTVRNMLVTIDVESCNVDFSKNLSPQNDDWGR